MPKHGGNQGGRPTKLTPPLLKELEFLIKNGNYKDVAAASVGISRDSLHIWLKRGARSETTKPAPKNWQELTAWKPADINAKDDRIYKWFSDIIKKAEADHEINANLTIQSVCIEAAKNGTYDEKLKAVTLIDKRLQNKYPYKYKGIQRVETTARVTVDDVTQLDDEDLDARIAHYEQIARENTESEN